MDHPSPPPLLLTGLALGACLGLGACSAKSDSVKSEKLPEPSRFREPEAWSPEMMEVQRTTGLLLADIDRSLRAWNKLEVTGTDAVDQRTASALKDDLTYKATKHQDVLVEQLRTGPPANRQVAALALGFSRQGAGMVIGMRHTEDNAQGIPLVREAAANDPLPPLLAALRDPVEGVVANAAMGIGMLGRKDTPLTGLLEVMELHPAPTARANAANSLFRLVQSGAEDPRLEDVAQRGLLDSEPGVRTQCALVCAHRLIVPSIETLGLMLHDDENLPASAAARALYFIGSREDTAKGRCARALTAAMAKVRPRVRRSILENLAQLANKNYGHDADQEWIEWAHRIP